MDDFWFEQLAAETPADESAGTRLRARVYTALVRKQMESGPIASVSETKTRGRDLCVFEELVQIPPFYDLVEKRAAVFLVVVLGNLWFLSIQFC